MSDEDIRSAIHELDVTIRVGKHGIDSVVEELQTQLDHRPIVKVKFNRSLVSETPIDELADSLSEKATCTLIETRGHTAVYHD